MGQSLKSQIDEQITKQWKIPHAGPSDSPREDGSRSRGYILMTIQPKDLPALSAWLLEYPVGYTFSDDRPLQTEFSSQVESAAGAWSGEKTNLDGEPLVLVKVKISGNKELGDQ
jgi:hypothetical protein